MAYQPKSYKKFVATAATATLVATAVVPAAFADEVKPAAFTDVAKQYEDAVNFVVSNNISSGLTETTFGVSQQIKRGDAAILIAKAAGLNDEKAPQSGFSDVPTRGVLAINSLKAAGVVNGKSATNFGFNDSITRGEAAIMLSKAFKLTGDTKEVKFTDVNDRYMEAVAALVKEGVTNGISATQFGTTNNIKRGDFARFIYALEEYVVLPNAGAPVINYTGDTTINVANGAAFTVPTVTVTDDKDTTLAATQVITDAAGNTVQAIDTTVAGTYKITYSAVDSDGNKAKDVVVTVVVAPGVPAAVSAVSVVDAQNLKVSFNRELDQTSAETEANYTVAGATVAEATLSDDKKSVNLRLTASLTNDTQYVVTAKKEIKTADGKAFAEKDFVTTILFNDEVAPTVSAISTPNGALRITFSERIAAPTTADPLVVVINGQSISLTSATGVKDNTVTIPRSALQSLPTPVENGKSYSIAIAGAQDLRGNDMVLYASNFAYQTVTDTTAPTVASVTAVDENTFAIKFSEEISVAPKVIASINGVPVTLSSDDNDGVTFEYSVVSPLFENGNTENLVLNISETLDLGNNLLVPVVKSVTLTKDTVKPTLTNTVYDAATKTTVLTFSEKISRGTGAVTAINNNTSQATTVTATATGTDNKLTISGLTTNGSYNIRLAAGAVVDNSVSKNTSAAVTTDVTVASSTKVTVSADQTTAVTGDAINVSYSESVTGGTGATSAANPANYKIDGQPLPTGTVITLNAASDVASIQLPAGSFTSDRTAILTVSNVKATSGSIVDTTNLLIDVEDTKAPVLNTVSVSGGDLVLTLSEAVQDSTFLDATTDFAVRVNGVQTGFTVATGAKENDNQLVLSPVSNGISFATGTVTVEVISTANGTDLNGVRISRGTTVTATR